MIIPPPGFCQPLPDPSAHRLLADEYGPFWRLAVSSSRAATAGLSPPKPSPPCLWLASFWDCGCKIEMDVGPVNAKLTPCGRGGAECDRELGTPSWSAMQERLLRKELDEARQAAATPLFTDESGRYLSPEANRIAAEVTQAFRRRRAPSAQTLTICADCRWCGLLEQTWPYERTCKHPNARHLVTGQPTSCVSRNNGSCPDFEAAQKETTR